MSPYRESSLAMHVPLSDFWYHGVKTQRLTISLCIQASMRRSQRSSSQTTRSSSSSPSSTNTSHPSRSTAANVCMCPYIPAPSLRVE